MHIAKCNTEVAVKKKKKSFLHSHPELQRGKREKWTGKQIIKKSSTPEGNGWEEGGVAVPLTEGRSGGSQCESMTPWLCWLLSEGGKQVTHLVRVRMDQVPWEITPSLKAESEFIQSTPMGRQQPGTQVMKTENLRNNMLRKERILVPHKMVLGYLGDALSCNSAEAPPSPRGNSLHMRSSCFLKPCVFLEHDMGSFPSSSWQNTPQLSLRASMRSDGLGVPSVSSPTKYHWIFPFLHISFSGWLWDTKAGPSFQVSLISHGHVSPSCCLVSKQLNVHIRILSLLCGCD